MADKQIAQLVGEVQANPKYQLITQDLIERLAKDAFRRELKGKAAVKYVRNKLHQIGGAYFREKPDFTEAHRELINLPKNFNDNLVQQFCRQTMHIHASTAERIGILENFFTTCLEPITPVESILDLACGLNPLAIPWMPLLNQCNYIACDIYLDMLELVKNFMKHFEIVGKAIPCDIIGEIPSIPTQITFLLKTIPCLEQVDKTIGLRLFDAIKSKYILVSFPVRSLSGAKKGMPDFYRNHFYDLIADKNWEIREFSFESELAFLVTK